MFGGSSKKAYICSLIEGNMKIGFDAKRLFNNFTGLGNYSRTMIDILTTYVPEHQYLLYSPKIIENHVTMPYLENTSCRTIIPSGMMRGSLWRTYGMTSALSHDEVDLFHGLSNEIPVGLERQHIPSVVTIHDVAFHTFPDMYRWHDRMIYDRKWKYACRHANHIIAISESTKADILRFYKVPEEKISVVYQPVNGVYYEAKAELSQFDKLMTSPQDLQGVGEQCPKELKPADGKPYMLYVGSINSRKNLMGIVKAMELLPADLQIPLTIVGEGKEYKHEVEQYIAEHHLEHLFQWTSAIDSTSLKRLYANATLFLYPSFYEGFGLPVVEALLSGCPVLTSNTSSLPEAGGPGSLKVDPKNVEEIREGIVTILTNDALRNQMIEEGRQYAIKTFHPETLARKVEEVYNKVK